VSARLVVIGGGLAGIAAALRLAEAGRQPLLIETRRKLGGRATSFIDPRNDHVLDNCQHVVMGCCANLLDLYDRLGVLGRIEWNDAQHWTAGKGVIDKIRPSRMPAPFHFAPSFGRLRFLDREDRAGIRRAMWRMIRLGPAGRQRWAGRAFTEFLRETRQTEPSIRRFWQVVIASALNVACDRADAAAALHVFQDGFLANRFGAAIGLSAVPLWNLYDPAVERIDSLGGDVVTGVSAKALAFDGSRVTGVVTPDGVINASIVVSAVPYDRLNKLVSDTMRRADSRLRRLAEFESSPILAVHLWFKRAVMDMPHLVVVDHGVQWLFNKGMDADGRQRVHAVVSAADAWMDLDEEEIARRITTDIHDVLPASRGLHPVDVRTVKEKRATFAVVPGVDQIRPRAAASAIGLGGGIPNLFLAGDWCDTGWPATMEGAVRSGYEAAAAITGDAPALAADLPPGFLAHLLGLRSAMESAPRS